MKSRGSAPAVRRLMAMFTVILGITPGTQGPKLCAQSTQCVKNFGTFLSFEMASYHSHTTSVKTVRICKILKWLLSFNPYHICARPQGHILKSEKTSTTRRQPFLGFNIANLTAVCSFFHAGNLAGKFKPSSSFLLPTPFLLLKVQLGNLHKLVSPCIKTC